MRASSSTMAWRAVAVMSAAIGCSGGDHPPRADLLAPDADDASADSGDGGAISFDGAIEAALNCGAVGVGDGVCTCQELGQKPTPLYLVLDRSGSMADAIAPATLSKWDTIRIALFDLDTGIIRHLGARIAVGLATFPQQADDVCADGRELVATATGSPALYDRMALALSFLPRGGTPTAATLRALTSTILALPRPTYVLLATDGGPNCATTGCTIDKCDANLSGTSRLDDHTLCDATVNCCDAAYTSVGGGPLACVDVDATQAAVAALASAGVKTFVFGIPGAEPYAKWLDDLAVTGGTAIDGATGSPASPKFYLATDATRTAFEKALKAIAAAVVDTCDITLDRTPDNPALVNVVADGVPIAKDPIDGWSFGAGGDTSHVFLHGASCARINGGTVDRVQVVFGCQTILR